RIGVYLAAGVVLLGGVIYLVRNPQLAEMQYKTFHPRDVDRTFRGIWDGVLAGRGRGFIQLGVLLLIATPIARVAFSFFAFLRLRDWTYALITALVLALLLYS